MVETPNHKYIAPSEGTTDWHIPLNDNFENLDRDVEIRDNDAARENYEPKSGAKFLATDTEKTYVGDGSQWLELATKGKDPAFNSVSTSQIVDGISGNSYGVDELASTGSAKQPADAVVMLTGETPNAYGAYRSDGSEIVRDSDASAVVQAAIDGAASGDGHGLIQIGAGSYSLQSNINVKDNMTITGAGPGATVFNATGAGQEWTGTPTNLVLRDFTQDGNDQGDRTGINVTGATDSWLINLEVLNSGGRNGSTGSTPALRVTGGTRSHIVNCRVERSSSVSIEAAIGAVGCEIVNCVVKDGVYNSGAGFLHGISIEKSENCRIQNCYIEDSHNSGGKFSPALNANNADYALVSGNTVRNVTVGLYNANGPCYSNAYVNNHFYEFDGRAIAVKSGNAGAPTGTLIANNTIDAANGAADGIFIRGGADADIRNNHFRNFVEGTNGVIQTQDTGESISIVGNVVRDVDCEVFRIGTSQSDDPTLIANNYVERGQTSFTPNDAIIKVNNDYGIMTGNVFSFVNGEGISATVQISGGGGSSPYWRVSENYIRGRVSSQYSLGMNVDGLVKDNLLDTGKIGVNGGKFRSNTGLGGAELVLDDLDANVSPNESGTRSGKYTGDGTQGRTLNIAFNPEHLVVEGPDGTLYDAHVEFGTGYQHTAPTGELSLTDSGFIVGDGGNDADPNVSGGEYSFYAQ